jgi:hypothetical protein
MRTLALALVALAGCTSSPGATVERDASTTATPPVRLACVYDVRQPVQAYGELAGYFGPDGADCVPPSYGDVASVGLGLRGLLVKARVRRTDGAWSLYATTDDAWCGGDDWDGEVRLVSDLPRWHFEIDARCRTAPIVVEATIFGEAN